MMNMLLVLLFKIVLIIGHHRGGLVFQCGFEWVVFSYGLESNLSCRWSPSFPSLRLSLKAFFKEFFA